MLETTIVKTKREANGTTAVEGTLELEISV